jgi:hypothetical protein
MNIVNPRSSQFLWILLSHKTVSVNRSFCSCRWILFSIRVSLTGLKIPTTLTSRSHQSQVLSLSAGDGFSNFQVPSRNVWGNVNKVMHTNKTRPNKHKDPKWSKSRAAKVLKIDLPDMDFRRRAALQQASLLTRPHSSLATWAFNRKAWFNKLKRWLASLHHFFYPDPRTYFHVTSHRWRDLDLFFIFLATCWNIE